VKVKEVIRKLPETIEVDRSIAEAAQQMDQAAVGALVVVDQGQPVGIVTDRDLVVRGLARHVAPSGRIDGVMSMGLIALDADDDLRHAIDLFSVHAIRRLPVVDGDRVCGMITLDDLIVDVAQDLAEAIRPMTAQVLFGHAEPIPPVRVSG